jgi:nitrate/nitrite transport system ATP-binding protein
MDVGFAAKVAETRQLPNVSPIHQTTPAVVKAAREGLIEERFLDFSQLHKIYATRAMREFG